MSFPKPCGEIEKEKMVQPVTEVVTVQLLPQIICSVYTHIVLLTVQLYCFNCCAVHNSFMNTHTYTVYSYKEYAFYFYFLQNLFMFFSPLFFVLSCAGIRLHEFSPIVTKFCYVENVQCWPKHECQE